jgi:O-acetyl-ADP-ribose deacetylase (regulator of RNase III)
MMERFKYLKGDITKLTVDAIVNAANSTLLGGGGVDGAIHRAAGPGLLAACVPLRGCHTGEAKITPGFKLPAKFVIHTVGPIWHREEGRADDLLAACYRNSLALAVENQCKSIAFPAISTGVYGFPSDRAAHIAVQTIRAFLETDNTFEEVIAVCFDDRTVTAYENALAKE